MHSFDGIYPGNVEVVTLCAVNEVRFLTVTRRYTRYTRYIVVYEVDEVTLTIKQCS